MKHHALREASKVGVGLVAADLISTLLLAGTGFFPFTIFGITWESAVVWPVVVLDLILIAILSHYAWNMRLPIESPREKTLLLAVGTVFLIVAFLHLVRVAFGWDLIVANTGIPEWVSWLGVLIAGYLSYASFHFALHKH
ncbi:hypothetical protein EPO56_03215 [Patescibacteria group bacterium]|nr:MAG: hypothetical protein EPO56_03215 [Patescibacteria group bacterium]